MPYNIKGITVEINGDTSKLQEELDKVKAKTSGLTKSMKKVENASKLDPHNVETLALKAELTTTKMGSLAQQLALVKKGIADFPAQVKSWETSLASVREKQAQIQEAYYYQMTAMQGLVGKSQELQQAEATRADMVERYKSALSHHTDDAGSAYAQLLKQVELYDKQYEKVQRANVELAKEQQELSRIESELQKLDALWDRQKAKVDGCEEAIKRESRTLNQLYSELTKSVSEMEKQQRTIDDLNAEYKIQMEALLDIEDSIGRNTVTYQQQEKLVDDILKILGEEEQKLKDIEQSVVSATEKYREKATAVGHIKKNLEEESKKLEELVRKADTLSKKYDTQKDRVSRISKQLSDEQKELQRIEQSVGKSSNEYMAQATYVGKIQKSLEEEEKELQKIKQDISENNAHIKTTEGAMQNLANEFDDLESSAKNLNRNIETAPQKLTAMKVQAQALTAEFNKLASTSIGNNRSIIELYNSLDRVADAGEKAYQKTKWLSSFSLGALTGVVKTAMDFETAWTGVLKTVQGTPLELEKVNDGLKELATTTNSTYEEIAHYAELGGQMGIATNDIVEFTKTITELSDTTNVIGDEAAQSIAKIKNIFKGDEKVDVEYWSKMGSAIVDLGNNFATTEHDIVEMTQVMGSYTRLAGFNEQQTLALSATLSSLGIEANAGGSSMGQLITTIDKAVSKGGDDLKEFTDVSKMSAEEFTKAWKENPVKALMSLLDGLGSVENLNSTLGKLGISNIRVTRATKSLTGATDLLERALKTSNSAWKENVAMDEEAARRYETTAAKLKELWEQIKQVGASLGEELLPSIKSLADGLKSGVDAFSNMDKGTKDFIIHMLEVGAAIAPVSKGIGLLGSGGKNVIKFFTKGSVLARGLGNALGLGSKALDIFVDGMKDADLAKLEQEGVHLDKLNYSFTSLSSAIKKNGGLWQTLGAKIGLTESATSLLGTSLTGVGLAFGLAATLGKANMAFMKKNLKVESEEYNSAVKLIEVRERYNQALSDHRENVTGYFDDLENGKKVSDMYLDKIKDIYTGEKLSAYQTELLKDYVEQLNNVYPDLGLHVDEATGKIVNNKNEIIKNTEALEKNIEAAQKNARKRAVENASSELATATLEQQKLYAQTQEQLQKLNIEMDKYSQEMAKASSAGNMNEYNKLSQQRAELIKTYNDIKYGAMETKAAIADLNAEQAAMANYEETGDFTTIGKTLQKSFDNAIKSAQKAGIEIPKSIQEGIDNGTLSVNETAMFRDILNEFTAMQEKAKESGSKIPKDVSDGILANAGSVQEAWFMMSNLMEYQDIIADAGLNGELITEKIAQGIADGSISIANAMDNINQYFKLTSALESVGLDTSLITQKISDGLLSGSMTVSDAAKEMMSSVPDGVKEDFDKAVKAAKEGTADIKENSTEDLTDAGKTTGSTFKNALEKEYKDAEDFVTQTLGRIKQASKTPISVNVSVNKKTNESSNGGVGLSSYSDQVRRAFGDSISDGNYVVQNSNPSVNEQLMGTKLGRQLQNTFDTSEISDMVSKLDNVVNALLDASININLAPQQLDGNAITDSVQETIAIRDMLKNYGMGV